MAVVFVATCTTKIDRGNVGVVFDQYNRGVQNQVLTPGRHIIAPWQKVSKFPTTIKTVYMSADKKEGSKENESIKVKVKAKDGTLQSDLTFTYNFNAEGVLKLKGGYE